MDQSELQLRLERLEKEHRRLRWFAALLLLALGAAPYIEKAVRPESAIEALGFVLRDTDGRVRGRLASVGPDAFVHLYDTGGNLQAVLDGGTNGGSFAIYDAKGKMRCSATAGKCASILVHDTEGKVIFSAPPSDNCREGKTSDSDAEGQRAH